jgi:hypothetical protein
MQTMASKRQKGKGVGTLNMNKQQLERLGSTLGPIGTGSWDAGAMDAAVAAALQNGTAGVPAEHGALPTGTQKQQFSQQHLQQSPGKMVVPHHSPTLMEQMGQTMQRMGQTIMRSNILPGAIVYADEKPQPMVGQVSNMHG